MGVKRRARHWLVKSEPGSFSFVDLLASEERTTVWDGVRNYQARNYMRDGMRVGDRVIFYHSQIREPAAVGLAEVASEAYPDPTQFDPRSRYFDPKASSEQPRWFTVDLRALQHLPRAVTLAEMKADPALSGLDVVQRGSRLSVMPVSAAEFRHLMRLAGADP